MQIELENHSKNSGITKKRVSNLRGNSLIISPQLFDCLKEFNLPLLTDPGLEKGATGLRFKIKVVDLTDLYLSEIGKTEVLQPLKVPGHYVITGDATGKVVSDSILYSLGLSSPGEFRAAAKLAYKLNAVLRSFFERRGCELVSVLVSFVIHEEKVMIDGRFYYPDIIVAPPERNKTLDEFIIHGNSDKVRYYIKFFNKILE